MATWEFVIVALPRFEPPTHTPGASAAVHALNEEGRRRGRPWDDFLG